MALIDPRGRLFGKVHLLDAAAAALLFFVAFSTLYFAYSLSGLKVINILGVEPSNVVIGQHPRIRIRGSGFTQDCVVKLSEHSLGHPVLLGHSFLEVEVSSAIPPGLYHPIVVGPRQTAVAVQPISYNWKPRILEVSPRRFYPWEKTILEIRGERFEPGSSVLLGPIAAESVEFIDSGRLRARMPAGRFEPGPYILKVVNPRNLEGASDTPLTAIGVKPVNLSFVLFVDTKDLEPNRLRVLRDFGEGQRVLLQDEIRFARPLHLPQAPLPPPLPPPNPKKFLLWKRAPPKPKAANPEKTDYMQVPLVHLGLRGAVTYINQGMEYSFGEKSLHFGSEFRLIMNEFSFPATLLSDPVSEEPAGED